MNVYASRLVDEEEAPCYPLRVSASVVLRLAGEVPLAEWSAFSEAAGLSRNAGLFPYNVWRARSADIELRAGWPSAEEARTRKPPATVKEVQVTSYFDKDLPETGRLAALVLLRFGGEADVVCEALKPYMSGN
jgi:hypothetical protein